MGAPSAAGARVGADRRQPARWSGAFQSRQEMADRHCGRRQGDALGSAAEAGARGRRRKPSSTRRRRSPTRRCSVWPRSSAITDMRSSQSRRTVMRLPIRVFRLDQVRHPEFRGSCPTRKASAICSWQRPDTAHRIARHRRVRGDRPLLHQLAIDDGHHPDSRGARRRHGDGVSAPATAVSRAWPDQRRSHRPSLPSRSRGVRIVKAYTAEKREELVFAKGAHRLSFRNVAKSLTGVSSVSAFSGLILGRNLDQHDSRRRIGDSLRVDDHRLVPHVSDVHRADGDAGRPARVDRDTAERARLPASTASARSCAGWRRRIRKTRASRATLPERPGRNHVRRAIRN